jgi:hypothetical protein
MFVSNTGIAQKNTHSIQYPWLAKSGKFGYRDSTGTYIIQPKFDDAEPFKHGYAIVSVNGRYGLIDQTGKTIVPLRYPLTQLYSRGLFTLILTKKEYNAWWRFWQWKFMPGFNVLSTSNHGPFLVTKVPRARWLIQSLPGKRTLFRQKRMEENVPNSQYWKKDWYPYQNVPRDIEITSSGNALKVQNNLFLLGPNHKLKKTVGNVLDLINDTTVLAFKNEQYLKVTITGKSLDKENYTMVDRVQFHVDPDKSIEVKKQRADMYPFPTISNFIFKDHAGKTYLFPDLAKPLPAHISDYKRGSETVTASAILEGTLLITSIPDSKYFLVQSVFGKDNERKCLLLDGNGNWNTDIPAYEGLDQMLNNGELLFTRAAKKGILTRDLEFKDFPFDHKASPNRFSPNMYSGKDKITKKYGIYDTSKQAWQVTPQYSYIGDEIVPGTAIYTITKDNNGTTNEFYGLMDIKTNKPITPPIYDAIDDARVKITKDGHQISFYIDPITGKEYRD